MTQAPRRWSMHARAARWSPPATGPRLRILTRRDVGCSFLVCFLCVVLLVQDIAARIKKRFDSSYPSTTWHCIVGNHFAVSVTHQTKYLIFLEVAGQSVLLFKSQE